MTDITKELLKNNKVGKQGVEPRTPIATEMFIPNHSGIKGSQQAIRDLDARYVNVTGDTMTGTLNAPTFNVTTSFTISGVDIFARNNTWTGNNTFNVDANRDVYFTIKDYDSNTPALIFDDGLTPDNLGIIRYGQGGGFSTDKIFTITNFDANPTTVVVIGDIISTNNSSANSMTINTSGKLTLRDSAIHISSANDGDMDLEADVSLDFIINGTEQITLTDGSLKPTTNNDVDLGTSSLGYKNLYIAGESFQPHTQTQPTRALDTVYQNTTGHPIIVYGSCSCTYFDSNGADIGDFTCYTDSSNPPTTARHRGGVSNSKNIITTNSGFVQHCFFYLVVANNHYYKITTTTAGAGAVTLDYWNEVNF